MELDWFQNAGSAEEMLQADADTDTSMFEDERCGLCMLDIIDRGVLDCCQHWFCFKCIDDWSTITNLCPLCHEEFQLITCVPVVDTIGGNNTDEESLSRNDDWSVEGKNNTLSFPSYYIDENAVTCLDGDGCKLRSDSFTLEENLAFDTSIACDSCDTWYHAFCVGFDAESTVESWLCPRCLLDEARKVGASASELAQTQYYSGVAGSQCSTDTFSGKVSISVADDGETAMVVSLVEQKHLMEEPTEKSLTTKSLEFEKEDYINQLRSETPETSSDNPPLTKQKTDDLLSSKERDIGSSISTDMAQESNQVNHNSKSNFEDNAMLYLRNVSSIKCPQSIDKRTSEENATLRADEGLFVAGLSGESTQVSADELQHRSFPGDSCHTPVDGSNAQVNIPVLAGVKRRHRGHSAHATERKRVRLATEGLSRDSNTVNNAERTSDIGLSDSVSLNTSQEAVHDIISSRNESVALESAEEAIALDIMSIVQGTESKILRSNPANKLSERRDAAKPRVKKIMRRPVEDNESTAMVQTLRKEIREAIRDRSSDDVGKNIVDQKLLAAFRAAVSVPDAEPVKKGSAASVVKANRLILQKSKTRENLTKKIYATSSGKRRHSWYRDCEVEFWKHRCPKTTKNEKIDTLKSVLSLLKWDPEAKKAEETSKEGDSNSILSRLYLADASVFPRKDDIQPLAALDNNKADKTDSTPSLGSAPSKSNSSCLDNKTSNNSSSSLKTGASSSKGAQVGTADKSIKNIQKVKIDKPEDIKTDKRKWALQVLARKAESISSRPGHQKPEEDSALKGNYPLLAQLPLDMRPKTEPCRHNKISNSVRQVQLNRLAENLLKLTNISPIRKTAATELAVADAVNIEREIAQKSNSKAVYLNLCSQELRRQKSTCSQSAVDDPSPSTLVKVSTEGEPSVSPPALDPDVEKALKSAGLLADDDDDDDSDGDGDGDGDDDEEAKGRGPDNELEMDSHPELDIYGEFEYDIEDEDYIGTSTIKDAKLQTEEGESKMKVVFSTLATDKQETALDSQTIDKPSDELIANVENLNKVNNEESLSLPPDSTAEGVEEPTPTECEELYGPEKEPLFDNLALAPSSSDAKVNTNAQTKKSENEHQVNVDKKKQHKIDDSVTKKLAMQVQSYIKEHIRPLCKSGVITVDQYRWAVGKTTDKVMKYHSKAKNADFLIKEGEKVKKLAEQYVEAAKVKDKDK